MGRVCHRLVILVVAGYSGAGRIAPTILNSWIPGIPVWLFSLVRLP
ncbi:hypothetical protein KCP74_11495 [Salmonella enterica subsp. enterica]|nr:hypothetical protein KCP74_11495 [Salmonella enterica subsp. enterica]